jgi:hypothetical protein
MVLDDDTNKALVPPITTDDRVLPEFETIPKAIVAKIEHFARKYLDRPPRDLWEHLLQGGSQGHLGRGPCSACALGGGAAAGIDR